MIYNMSEKYFGYIFYNTKILIIFLCICNFLFKKKMNKNKSEQKHNINKKSFYDIKVIFYKNINKNKNYFDFIKEKQLILFLSKKITNYVYNNIEIGCGCFHSFIYDKQKQKLFLFGNNNNFELGKKDFIFCDYPIHNILETKNINSLNIKKFIIGGKHNLILMNDDNLFSFGKNENCQCGYDNIDVTKICYLNKIKSDEIFRHNIKQIKCGNEHNLILLKNGDVYGFGSNLMGELGMGKQLNYIIHPQKIVFENNDIITEIFAEPLSYSSFFYSKKSSTKSKLYSCGNNHYYNSNSNNDAYIYKPTIIKFFSNLSNDLSNNLSNDLSNDNMIYKQKNEIENIFTGYKHTFFLTKDNTLYFSGCNDDGVNGSNYNNINNIKEINYFKNKQKIIKKICCGGNLWHNKMNYFGYYTIFLTKNGELFFAGWNAINPNKYFSICNSDYNIQKINLYSEICSEKINNEQFIDVVCGAYNVMALTNKGEIFSWGFNNSYQTDPRISKFEKKNEYTSFFSFIMNKIEYFFDFAREQKMPTKIYSLNK